MVQQQHKIITKQLQDFERYQEITQQLLRNQENILTELQTQSSLMSEMLHKFS